MTKNEEKVRREVYLLLFLCIKLTYKGLDIVSKPTIDNQERHKKSRKGRVRYPFPHSMKASLTVKLIHSCKTNGALLHRKRAPFAW